jgi:hypothetical protein
MMRISLTSPLPAARNLGAAPVGEGTKNAAVITAGGLNIVVQEFFQRVQCCAKARSIKRVRPDQSIGNVQGVAGYQRLTPFMVEAEVPGRMSGGVDGHDPAGAE